MGNEDRITSSDAFEDACALDDAELVRRCLARDETAWRLLVERYQRLVYSVLRAQGLSPGEAEDVFQEVFAALVEQLPGLRRPSALPKWLMTTAVRRSHQWKRTKIRDRRVPATDDHAPDTPVEALERIERQHGVMVALARLGGRCRTLLQALYRQPDPSYPAIAKELDMPVGSIGPTRARCLAKLLHLLGRSSGSEDLL